MNRHRFATAWMYMSALWLLSVAMPSQAQDYPMRPVRIVVPAAPSGSLDALARILAQGLSERWPQRNAFITEFNARARSRRSDRQPRRATVLSEVQSGMRRIGNAIVEAGYPA